MTRWVGLSQEKLAETANRYEAACLMAMQRARQLESDDAKFAARLSKMRVGIWIAVARELRELGCPEDKVADEVASIINFSVQKRALEGLPARGRA